MDASTEAVLVMLAAIEGLLVDLNANLLILTYQNQYYHGDLTRDNLIKGTSMVHDYQAEMKEWISAFTDELGAK